MPRWIFLLFFCACCLASDVMFAQHTDQSAWLNINQGGAEGLYGNGISLHDFNRDGLDDVTICTNGNGVRTYINTVDSLTEILLFDFIDGDIKQPVWVDFDNDGDADFFCTVYGGGCHLFLNQGALQFIDVTASLNLPSTSSKCFGAAWADYDRDGDLDVYVANYDFILPAALSNWLLRNNGDGTFTEVATSLGVTNGYRATFQPAWCDFNLDGWPDLFVINDKYHGNALYLNNAGTFTDVSESYGMNHAMESMSNSWYDFDHDLDFDVYISNSNQGNKLLRNDGFFFSDIASETGTEVNSVCWNALWMDVEHDLKSDLHVATNSPFIQGNQNKLFEATDTGEWDDFSIQNDQRSVLAEARGDLNNDGFWDILQVSEYPVGTAYWMNNGSDNHYLKFALTGTVSNADGIGAYVTGVAGGLPFVKTIFCGAGFIAQDSRYETISLKNDLLIDSLEVHWPSGWIDVYTELDADSTYIFTEGETYAVSIIAQQDSICAGESTNISVYGDGNWIWQNGSSGTTIQVDEPGWYAMLATNDFGFTYTDSIYIALKSDPVFELFITEPACYGDAGGVVNLISDSAVSWFLDEWITGFYVDSLATGNYEVTVVGANSCAKELSIFIGQPDAMQASITYDTACYQSFTQLSAEISGGNAPYEILWNGIDPLNAYEGSFTVSVFDALGCFLEHPYAVMTYDSLNAVIDYDETNSILSIACSGGFPPYQYLWSNGQTDNNIAVSEENLYACLITDAAGCEVNVMYNLVGLNQGGKEIQLTFYPVPATDFLFVSSAMKQEIVITDDHGKIVLYCTLREGLNQIPVQAFLSGVYLLKTKTGTYTFIKV